MKIGDRVRFKETYGYVHKGTEGVLIGVPEGSRHPQDLLVKVRISDYNLNVYAERLEVISEEPKEPTDEELAATLRDSLSKFVEAKQLLTDRGYKVTMYCRAAIIKKTQTISL